MIHHHPEESLLLDLTAGSIARGPAVVVQAHLEQCQKCSAKFREFEVVGGVLLEQIEPAILSAGAFERALERIRRNEPPSTATPEFASAPRRREAEFPAGGSWPRSLRGGVIKPWRRLGPGVRWSRVVLPDRSANLHLLRVAAGKKLPVHGHRGGELSQVIFGAFNDGDEHFTAGDFIEADDGDHHQPVVTTDSECICLVSVEGHVAFDQLLARLLGSILGM